MKTIFKVTFSLITIIAFSINSFAQDVSIGRAPVNNDVKHPINYGNHIEGSTIGYGSDGTGDGWYSVDVPSGSLTLIGPPTGTFNMGGDFDGSGTYYATRFPDTLVTVDPETGAETVVAAITGVPEDHTVTSMAWDATTNTMFLGSTDLSISQLFTINLATGTAALVGTIGQRGLIALACNCGGDLYSVDLADSLWSIDKNTAVGTAIGNLGYNVNYGQDADFDPADGVLYLAAYNNTTNTGQLRTADLTTGNSTLLMDWGSLQITDFGIAGSCGPPCPVGAPTNPSPANGAINVPIIGNTLSWSNSAGTTANEVWFDNEMVYDGSPITSYLLFSKPTTISSMIDLGSSLRGLSLVTIV